MNKLILSLLCATGFLANAEQCWVNNNTDRTIDLRIKVRLNNRKGLTGSCHMTLAPHSEEIIDLVSDATKHIREDVTVAHDEHRPDKGARTGKKAFLRDLVGQDLQCVTIQKLKAKDSADAAVKGRIKSNKVKGLAEASRIEIFEDNNKLCFNWDFIF